MSLGDWSAEINAIAAAATAAGVLVAMFWGDVQAWRMRPQLRCIVSKKWPELVKMGDGEVGGTTVTSIWFRASIVNTGKWHVEGVRLYLSEVWRLNERKERIEQEPVLPTYLNKSFGASGSPLNGEVEIDVIPRGMSGIFDLAHIFNPSEMGRLRNGFDPAQTTLQIAAQVVPVDLSTWLKPGRYEFVLNVVCRDYPPQPIAIEVHHQGTWNDDLNQMTWFLDIQELLQWSNEAQRRLERDSLLWAR